MTPDLKLHILQPHIMTKFFTHIDSYKVKLGAYLAFIVKFSAWYILFERANLFSNIILMGINTFYDCILDFLLV